MSKKQTGIHTPRVVHTHLFDPSNALFKQLANRAAELHVITCDLKTCELEDRGQCVCRCIFGGRCPHGRLSIETGPTLRAKKFYQWISEKRKLKNDSRYLDTPKDKLAFVGNYVFLPYAHMSMIDDVNPKSTSRLFCFGARFIPRESWTVKTVIDLIDFRPRAIFTSQEIATYQREVVPLFIAHIRELDPEMWDKLIEARPSLDTTPNYVGRMALVKTLNSPITIPAYNAQYPVEWEWDGNHLKTSSRHAYGSTWGHIKAKSAMVEIVPSDDATIVVKSNEWVNKNTVFVD